LYIDNERTVLVSSSVASYTN